MLLTSGQYKGLKIRLPTGMETRPTRARVRAAALNALQDRLGGARVLDLFAGSGAFGFEALSRGGETATFVDSSVEATRCLKSTVTALRQRRGDSQKDIKIIAKPVSQALGRLPRRSFEIVWADPPYHDAVAWWTKAQDDIHPLLVPDGVVVLESSADDQKRIREALVCFQILKQKRYGASMLTYLQTKDEMAGNR